MQSGLIEHSPARWKSCGFTSCGLTSDNGATRISSITGVIATRCPRRKIRRILAGRQRQPAANDRSVRSHSRLTGDNHLGVAGKIARPRSPNCGSISVPVTRLSWRAILSLMPISTIWRVIFS